MDIETFEDLVDRLGEDASMWPSPEREAGLALMETSAQAREIVAAAADVRRALVRREAPRAPAGLADRIVAGARTAAPVVALAVEAPAGTTAEAADWRRSAVRTLHPSLVLPLCFLIGLGLSLLSPGGRGGETALVGPSILSDLLQ